MDMDYKRLEKRVAELEELLAKTKKEARYYQNLAKEVGKGRLRKIYQLSERTSEYGKIKLSLQECSDKLYGLFDLSPLAIAITDLETGKLLDVNHKFCELTKKVPEQLLGKTTTELGFYSEGNRTQFLQGLGSSGEVHGLEMTFALDDASIIHTLMFAKLLQFGGKKLILTVFYDLTERIQQEKELRRSEEKYRQLANLLPQIVFETNENGIVTFANRFAFESLGYTKEEYNKGINVLQTIIPQDRDRAWNRMNRIIEGEKLVNTEYTALRKDGSTFPVMVYSTPILSNGKALGLRGIMADLSKVKRAHTALRESEEKIARLKKMEALGLLAGGVAHDLNNVLSGVVCIPELILMDLPNDSQIREPVEEIQKSGNRAAAIVQDLVTVARGVAAPREPLNINDIAKGYLRSAEFDKLQTFHPLVKIKTNFESKLFNTSGSHVHMEKVLMNLVSNASEAIDGSGIITISTANRYLDKSKKGFYDNVKKGEYVILSVSDDGAGISPDDLDRIFEPFYTKKEMGRSGTGLGLSVVWSVVQDHEGCINVKSDENGTTFELYFPVTKEVMPDKSLAVPIKDLKGNGEKVLVVDDLESQREISNQMLGALGYKPSAVSSGEEAVEYLKERTVDLLLLDMIMDPGMNGRETFEQIKKIHPDQKAVIVSGFVQTDDVREAQRLGAGQYLKKPLTLEKLGMAIKQELM